MQSRVAQWVLGLGALVCLAALLIFTLVDGGVPPARSGEIALDSASNRPDRSSLDVALPQLAEREPVVTAEEEPARTNKGETSKPEMSGPEHQPERLELADRVMRMSARELEASDLVNTAAIPLDREQRIDLEAILEKGREAIDAAREARGRLVVKAEADLCERGLFEVYDPPAKGGLRKPEPDHPGQIRGLRTWQGQWVSVKIEPPEHPELLTAIHELESAKLDLLTRIEQVFRQ